MELFGYFCALLIGLIMGLIGGGGSVLGVPIFVYLFSLAPVAATAYSLFVVGITASVGAITNARKGQIDVRTGIVFAVPSFIAVYLTRAYLMPWIPETIVSTDAFVLTKDLGIMLLFGVVMLLAGYFMVRGRKDAPEQDQAKEVKYRYAEIMVEGLLIGVLTGLVGAGGGFIIVPALVLLANIPMKKAIGTSLMIISIKSLIGFLGDVQNMAMDWMFLITFSTLAILGILIGSYLSNYVKGKVLKKGFGWFVVTMAVVIISLELT